MDSKKMEYCSDNNDEPLYEMKPTLQDRPRKEEMEEIIRMSMLEYFVGKCYDKDKGSIWSSEISQIIKDKIKKCIKNNKYKVIVNILLAERRGSAMKIMSRCFWDCETDLLANELYKNESILCIAAVYAVYYY